MRIGQGIDIHPFSDDPHRPLRLGGVLIEGARGLAGHSDADALCHALADAVLAAAGLPDLGRHFPDTDPRWAGADSVDLLQTVVGLAAEQGFGCVNADCTVVAEAPRLAPHTEAMAAMLSGRSEVNSHFTLPPFTYQELADPRVHRVLSSYDVLGGPSTNVLMVTTSVFRQDNPKTYDAFVAALDQAMAWIAANKPAAAALYLKASGSKE